MKPHRVRMTHNLIVNYGLFKKMVIADNVALHVNSIFADGAALDNTALVWWGALCFGIQIYCDFSGYTDIALGSAVRTEGVANTFVSTKLPAPIVDCFLELRLR